VETSARYVSTSATGSGTSVVDPASIRDVALAAVAGGVLVVDETTVRGVDVELTGGGIVDVDGGPPGIPWPQAATVTVGFASGPSATVSASDRDATITLDAEPTAEVTVS